MLRSIKRAAIILFVVLAACSVPPKIHRPDLVKQCEVPELYALSSFLLPKDKEFIIEGFEYWNTVANSVLFTPIGSLPIKLDTFIPMGYTIVGYAEDNHPMTKCNYLIRRCSYAEVHTNYNNNKCLTWAIMRINRQLWNRVRAEVKTTIARHEVGHVLGFINTTEKGHIMTIPIDKKKKHPREASKTELEALLTLYPYLKL